MCVCVCVFTSASRFLPLNSDAHIEHFLLDMPAQQRWDSTAYMFTAALSALGSDVTTLCVMRGFLFLRLLTGTPTLNNLSALATMLITVLTSRPQLLTARCGPLMCPSQPHRGRRTQSMHTWSGVPMPRRPGTALGGNVGFLTITPWPLLFTVRTWVGSTWRHLTSCRKFCPRFQLQMPPQTSTAGSHTKPLSHSNFLLDSPTPCTWLTVRCTVLVGGSCRGRWGVVYS